VLVIGDLGLVTTPSESNLSVGTRLFMAPEVFFRQPYNQKVRATLGARFARLVFSRVVSGTVVLTCILACAELQGEGG